MKRFYLALSFLSAPLVLLAQQNAPPLPSGPLLKRAPEFAAWTVIYHYPDAEGGPASAAGGAARKTRGPVMLKQLTVTKTKNIYHEEKVFTDGSIADRWRVGNLQINDPPGSKLPPSIVEEANVRGEHIDPASYTDYSRTDFPGLEWVSAQSYLAIRNVSGRDCVFFGDRAAKDSGEAPRALPNPSAAALASDLEKAGSWACIDLETRLPVASRRGDEIAEYHFGSRPQAMLTLPPNIQSALEQRAASRALLLAKPAHA